MPIVPKKWFEMEIEKRTGRPYKQSDPRNLATPINNHYEKFINITGFGKKHCKNCNMMKDEYTGSEHEFSCVVFKSGNDLTYDEEHDDFIRSGECFKDELYSNQLSSMVRNSKRMFLDLECAIEVIEEYHGLYYKKEEDQICSDDLLAIFKKHFNKIKECQ